MVGRQREESDRTSPRRYEKEKKKKTRPSLEMSTRKRLCGCCRRMQNPFVPRPMFFFVFSSFGPFSPFPLSFLSFVLSSDLLGTWTYVSLARFSRPPKARSREETACLLFVLWGRVAPRYCVRFLGGTGMTLHGLYGTLLHLLVLPGTSKPLAGRKVFWTLVTSLHLPSPLTIRRLPPTRCPGFLSKSEGVPE